MSPEAFSTVPNKVSNSYIDSPMNYLEFLKRSWQNISSFRQDVILKEDVIFCQFDVKGSASFSAQMQKFTLGLDLNAARNLDLRLLITL